MGYAQTLPSGLLNIASGGYGGATVVLTNADQNIAVGSITTPDYKTPLTHAFIDVRVNARSDTSGAVNVFDKSNNGYVGLNDGSGTFSCGAIPEGYWRTEANGFVGECLLKGRSNIAASLQPNTAYTCQFMHVLCTANNLILFNVGFELNLFFGV